MGVIRHLKNPFTGNYIFPVTKTKAVYNDDGERLDNYLGSLYGSPSSNILINSNFRNPVNQRGVVSGNALTRNTYTLDRWKYITPATDATTTANLGSNYTSFVFPSTNTYHMFIQFVEFPNTYKDTDIALSMKYRCKGGKAQMQIEFIDTSNTHMFYYVELINDGEWHTLKELVPKFPTSHDISKFGVSFTSADRQGDVITSKWLDDSVGTYTFNTNPSTTLDIEWVKAEVGKACTPYVPRLYAEELQLCKRFYQEWQGSVDLRQYSVNNLYFRIPFECQVRKSPTLSFKDTTLLNTSCGGVFTCLNGTLVTGFTITLPSTSVAPTQGAVVLAVKNSHGYTSGGVLFSCFSGCAICIDAEL